MFTMRKCHRLDLTTETNESDMKTEFDNDNENVEDDNDDEKEAEEKKTAHTECLRITRMCVINKPK